MSKKKFSTVQRFAIWKCHHEKCWLCKQPLSFKESTIDHVLPENLLKNELKRKKILEKFGLNDQNFDINGYENLLPSHSLCNKEKKTHIIPSYAFILMDLSRRSQLVRQTITKLTSDRDKEKVFAKLLIALEDEIISFDELIDFIKPMGETFNFQIIPKDLILLNGGYWVYKNEIVSEGYCNCENNQCTDSNEKIYCYFTPNLSPWVIKTGLYFKCYDEIINCPRCKKKHKRGHIGKKDICDLPFRNQISQQD